MTWDADHLDGAGLQFIVAFDPHGDESGRPVSLVTPGSSQAVGFGHLPGGNALPYRRAVQRRLPHRAGVQPFVPVAGARVRLSSSSLVYTQTVLADQLTTLQGQGLWLDDDSLEIGDLAWHSSIDGDLGRGAAVPMTVRRPPRTSGAGRVCCCAETVRANRQARRHSVDLFGVS
ncbi:hypothetical protein [Actinoplanes sp. NPDC023714]|uniref:hypothetical protein n=1 Tax=Actinoplanes sp. NPDC023714 TaxID=3154322 RepID=UPI0033F52A87